LKYLNLALRWVFFTLLVKPVVLIVIGLNVRNRELLPVKGPAVIVANHNSHLDTLVLISMLGARLLPSVKPVAAADYFLKNRFLAWFAIEIIGILPIRREKTRAHPLHAVFAALRENKILILFPEGSRGEPETMQSLKRGVAHISREFTDVPITPIYLRGLGKALPKGEAILVPFFCDVFVGEPLYGKGSTEEFMHSLSLAFEDLKPAAEDR
jgi:1-acyl-sn-glycerol-3-phosphate acyltransferase